MGALVMKKPLLIIIILILALLVAITIYYFFFRQEPLAEGPGQQESAGYRLAAREISHIDLDSECYSLGASRDFLYMGLNNKIAVIDVSDPASLKLASEYSIQPWAENQGRAISLLIEDNIIYACPNHRLDILQVGGGTTISHLSSLELEGFDIQLAKIGSTLYIKGSYMGPEQQELARIYAVDVSRAGKPELMWSLDIDEAVYSIAAHDDIVYAGGRGALYAIDTGKQGQERIVTSDLEGWINHLQAGQDYLYAAGSQGISTYSLGPKPELQQAVDLGGYLQKIMVGSEYIWGLLQTGKSSQLVEVDRQGLEVSFRQPVEGLARYLYWDQQTLFMVTSEVILSSQDLSQAEHVPSRLLSYQINY